MKIVIAGAGAVGSHLAKMLSEGYHEITIIDSDEERLASVRETMDVITVLGNPSSFDILRAAGVDKADLFVAVNPDIAQDVNIVCSIIAKKMGAKKVTARINNLEYLDSANKKIFTELGIDLLFYPEKMAADEITGLLKQSDMSEFMNFANGQLQLVVFRLDEGAPMVGRTPLEFPYKLDNLPFRTVAIAREDETIIPHGDTIFRSGDLVFAIARRECVDEIMSISGKEYIDIRRITILGGGRLGEMVARRLEKSADFVKLIEINRDRCEELAEELENTLVINADGRNSDILLEEDVRSCDAFVAVTNSSETNIMSCLAAKRLGVPKTIAEVENLEFINLAESIGVDSVINKKIITAGNIFRFTMSNKVRTIKCLNGSDANVIEYIVNPDSEITKAPIKDLNFPKNATIGGVIRGNDTFIAVGDTRIKAYDRVAVFSLPAAISKVEKFFN